MSLTKEYPLIKVDQWLPEWEEVTSYGEPNKRKPKPYFFVTAMPAGVLKRLSGVLQRDTANRMSGGEDIGIQRRHEKERSDEIKRFRQYGYPWSTLSAKSQTSQYHDLKMPGWLPSAIIANVKTRDDIQPERVVDDVDYCEIIEDTESSGRILLPQGFDEDWTPTAASPIEIIDGQHRLFAFDESSINEKYQLPVVIFLGLDLSWQAYLFYVVNIKPKKINPSLAFDLYPLLREADWLERADGVRIYRETRAQEIVQSLWQYDDSVFHQKINMLGETGNPYVNQASWIRTILNTFLKTGNRDNPRRYGGYFGCLDKENAGWSRVQQTGFLIYSLNGFVDAINGTDPNWRKALPDQNLFAKASLFNSDQGVRGYLQVLNDLMIKCWDIHNAHLWVCDINETEPTNENITAVIKEIDLYSSLEGFIQELNNAMSNFNWLTSDGAGLSEEARRNKMAYKGSSGYATLRKDVLRFLLEETSFYTSEVRELLEAVA